jgi:hypothetical protein
MQIISKATGHGFDFNETEAIIIADILTPVLCDFAPSERIGAMALQIACASWEECGGQHECLDGVIAQLMGAAVEELVKRGFKAQREKAAEEVAGEPEEGEPEEGAEAAQ